MKTCGYAGEPFSPPRSHPWQGSASDPSARYHDFTAAPQLIRSALEDFVPWARYGAIEAFYTLLERLNHEHGALESNDCAFVGPATNAQSSVAKDFACSGRVMLLFRALHRNIEQRPLPWLENLLQKELSAFDEPFSYGLVGTALVPTRYLSLAPWGDEQLGHQLMISFWAWGDDEGETMLNLARVFKNLSRALRATTAAMA
jgi:hypothetical protein